MRNQPPPKLESSRIQPIGVSSDVGAMWGVFLVKIRGKRYKILSSGEAGPQNPAAAGWEHVSVSTPNNVPPTWDIMHVIKDLFWEEEETVIQFHPRKSDYVNIHVGCLHLWKPPYEVRLPPTSQV